MIILVTCAVGVICNRLIMLPADSQHSVVRVAGNLPGATFHLNQDILSRTETRDPSLPDRRFWYYAGKGIYLLSYPSPTGSHDFPPEGFSLESLNSGTGGWDLIGLLHVVEAVVPQALLEDTPDGLRCSMNGVYPAPSSVTWTLPGGREVEMGARLGRVPGEGTLWAAHSLLDAEGLVERPATVRCTFHIHQLNVSVTARLLAVPSGVIHSVNNGLGALPAFEFAALAAAELAVILAMAVSLLVSVPWAVVDRWIRGAMSPTAPSLKTNV